LTFLPGAVFALSPLPPQCVEDDGAMSTLYSAAEERFLIVVRSEPERELVGLIDCMGTENVWAQDSYQGTATPGQVLSHALFDPEPYTLDEIVVLLQEAGHGALVIRGEPRSCHCAMVLGQD